MTKAERTAFLMGLILGAASWGPAFAADLPSIASITEADGVVMVDQGKGFRTAKIGANLYENDRVITLDGSTAQITFNNGCRTKLNANNLVVINAAELCMAKVADAAKTMSAAVAKPGSILLPATLAGAVVGGYILLKGVSDE